MSIGRPTQIDSHNLIPGLRAEFVQVTIVANGGVVDGDIAPLPLELCYNKDHHLGIIWI
jgi:hypothetical protein